MDASKYMLFIAVNLTLIPQGFSASYDDGAQLYSQNCAGCHSPLLNSTKRNRSANQIQVAISNIGIMNFLSNLSDSQLEDISFALSNDPPPPPASGMLAVRTSSGNLSSVTFATKGNYVRPALPDASQWVELRNTAASGMVKIKSTSVNSNLVTVSPNLNAGSSDDILLAPGQTRRFSLSFKASEAEQSLDAVFQIQTEDGGKDQIRLTLSGKSTFNADITYDGSVNLADLAIVRENFGAQQSQNGYDAEFDLNNDGGLNLADLAILRAEFGRIVGQQPTPPPPPPPPPSPSPEPSPEGVQLYEDNCAGCHGNLATSDKAGRSEQQIRQAIGNVPAMRNLSNLSDADVRKIADVLFPDEEITGSASNQATSHLVLGTRNYWISTFNYLFGKTAEDKIYQLADVYISSTTAFGGHCSDRDDEQKVFGSEAFNRRRDNCWTNDKSTQSPQPGQYRRAVIRLVCGELLFGRYGSNPLTRAGLTATSALSDENFRRLVKFYFPTLPISDQLIEHLKSVGQAARSQNMELPVAWSYVQWTMCSSSLMEF